VLDDFQSYEKIQHPEDLVRSIIAYAFEQVINSAREEYKQQPDRLIVLINSENLDGQLAVHVQQINENAVDSVVSRFEIVDQSGRAKGRGSLYGAPFTIDVTAVSTSLLKKPKKYGKGRPALKPIRHNINEAALYKIQQYDGDTICLFMAINLSFRKVTLRQQRFSDYTQHIQRQRNDAIALMTSIGAPLNKPEYCVEDWGEQIVNHYNNISAPKTFKLFAFSDIGFYKPYYHTETNLYDHALTIFYKDNHFDTIINIKKFFKVRNYCFSCMKPYYKKDEHSKKCKLHCLNCCTVFTTGPCKQQHGYDQKCDECFKKFINVYV
jgi:hypothetical protein